MKLITLLGAMTIALFLAACLLTTPTPRSTETPVPDGGGAAAGQQPTTAAIPPATVPRATAAAEPTPGGLPTSTPAVVTPTPRLVSVGGRLVKQYGQPPLMTIDPNARFSATFRTTNGPFTVDLFASQAPETVNNFVFLAEEGFYDGLIFHRVIQGFMIQGGDPKGDGTSGPGYQFGDEIVPALVFDRPGVLAMANRGVGTGTNGSQFFITVEPTPHLNGNHTIFGRVTSGQDIVDAISRVSTGQGDRPVQPVVIQSIEITKSSG